MNTQLLCTFTTKSELEKTVSDIVSSYEIVFGKDKVALRLDYEDGDVTNNNLINIRLLCPNCFL